MLKTRKRDIAGVKVVTPPVAPGSRSTATAQRGSGGASGGVAAPAYAFEDFYSATRAAYEPVQVEIEDFDREEKAAQLSGWLRPTYDQAIADRERRTDTARAELDADALSRNMGTSAYVTDVKGRMLDSEARDVATLEAQFGAEVQKYLLEMEQSHSERKTETDIFNAGEWNDAMQKAYDSAMTMYNNYLSSLGGSGGGGGRKKAAAQLAGFDRAKWLENDRWAWDRIGDVDKETIYAYLGTVCTPEERDQIYYGNAPLYATIRNEMLKALGTKGTRQVHWDLPGKETYSKSYK